MILQLQAPTNFATSLGPFLNLNTQWPIVNPIGSVVRQNIVQNNTTTISPAGTLIPSFVAIIPPTANTQAWQLKGVTSDVGIPMSPALPGLFGLPSSGGIGIGLAAGTDQVFTIIWL